jgi:transposase
LGASLQRIRPQPFDLPPHWRPRPLFTPDEVKELVDTVETTDPQAHGLPGKGWTLRKLRCWLLNKIGRLASRSLLHKILRAAGLSWKKCKKLLGKGDPDKRAAFVVRLLELYEAVIRREVVLIYIDESHFHRDLENGYTWGRIGCRVWRRSCCAPLSDRINWYGAFNFTDGQCLIWNEGNCCKEHTAEFLQRVYEWLPNDGRRVVIIWDNAPWHIAGLVQQAGADLGWELIGLSSYSPDLNPIEGLWKWMREEVTQLQCYETMRGLFDACKAFIDRINKDPRGVVDRLWPRFELDPELEKLRFSS